MDRHYDFIVDGFNSSQLGTAMFESQKPFRALGIDVKQTASATNAGDHLHGYIGATMELAVMGVSENSLVLAARDLAHNLRERADAIERMLAEKGCEL